jgi:hypothetical protein
MPDLKSDLKDLVDLSNKLLEDMDEFKEDHIGAPTRNLLQLYDQQTIDAAIELSKNFEEAASKARRLVKIVQNNKGPEPKLT